MSRYVSFRDFDWVLLVLVLLICALGVVEIYSATLSTKFAGDSAIRSEHAFAKAA